VRPQGAVAGDSRTAGRGTRGTLMRAAGVRFVSPSRAEAYGTVAVFMDLEGNRWDSLGPSGLQK